MGTYSRPGSTPTSGTSRINPAMAALEAARGAQTKIEERVKGVRKFEEEAAERKRKLNEALANTQMLEEQGPFQGLETEFSDMVDRINKLDVASFDGNRAEYNEEYNNAMKILGDFQSIVGALDSDIDEYRDKSPEELNKLISRKALAEGKTGDYRKLLNDPSKMGMRIQGNQLIITNNGEDLFNGTSYLNSKKQGFGLVPYTADMQPEIDKTIIANAKNIKNLEKVSQIQKEINEGKQIKSEKVKYYADAYNAYKRRLKEDPRVDALVNEGTYQRFVDPDGDTVYDKAKNSADTKEAIIQYMLEQQFPDHDKVITVATTVKDVKKPKGKGEKDKSDYSSWIEENLRAKEKVKTMGPGGYEITQELDKLNPEQALETFYDKLVEVNPKYVYGSQIDMTGENANKIYKKVGQYEKPIPFSITEEQLQNDKYLNNLLVSESVL